MTLIAAKQSGFVNPGVNGTVTAIFLDGKDGPTSANYASCQAAHDSSSKDANMVYVSGTCALNSNQECTVMLGT